VHIGGSAKQHHTNSRLSTDMRAGETCPARIARAAFHEARYKFKKSLHVVCMSPHEVEPTPHSAQ